jgi:hypothetical protein
MLPPDEAAVVATRGAEVIGGVALNRAKLPAHTDEFVGRLLDSLAAPGAPR